MLMRFIVPPVRSPCDCFVNFALNRVRMHQTSRRSRTRAAAFGVILRMASSSVSRCSSRTYLLQTVQHPNARRPSPHQYADRVLLISEHPVPYLLTYRGNGSPHFGRFRRTSGCISGVLSLISFRLRDVAVANSKLGQNRFLFFETRCAQRFEVRNRKRRTSLM